MAKKQTETKEAKSVTAEKTNKYAWEEADAKVLKTRLNRVVGQLKGIVNMIDEGRQCEDVLIQLASSYKSIRCVTNMILCNHLVDCVKNGVMQGKYEMLNDAMEIFKRYQ